MVRGVYFMMVFNMLVRLVMAVLLVGLFVILMQKLSQRGNLPLRKA